MFADTSNPNSDVGDLKMFKDSMVVTNPVMVGHSFGGATTLMALGKETCLKKIALVHMSKKTASTQRTRKYKKVQAKKLVKAK